MKLTSLCHKEPQVFGTLVPIFEKHHLLLVSVTVVLLCVHVFAVLCSFELILDFLNYRPRNVLHSTFFVRKSMEDMTTCSAEISSAVRLWDVCRWEVYVRKHACVLLAALQGSKLFVSSITMLGLWKVWKLKSFRHPTSSSMDQKIIRTDISFIRSVERNA